MQVVEEALSDIDISGQLAAEASVLQHYLRQLTGEPGIEPGIVS